MPVFSGVAEHAAEGCLVKPLMLQFFQDPDIEFEFDLSVLRPTPRKPDGWFHASTHPLASARELYVYLTAPPGAYLPERMGYVGWMSTMFGTLTHTVVEAALERMGVVVPLPPGPCVACGRPRRPKGARPSQRKYCDEHGGIHAETISRCHLDSILNFGPQGTFGFDLKWWGEGKGGGARGGKRERGGESSRRWWGRAGATRGGGGGRGGRSARNGGGGGDRPMREGKATSRTGGGHSQHDQARTG